MSRFVGCGQESTMISIPSSFIPLRAWAICWTSPMTIKKPAIFGRPTSLAARVTGLVAVAMMLVFRMLNWISTVSRDRHFAEMDEDELGVIANSGTQALGEANASGYALALSRAVRGHHGVYYY